ncbi:MAG TPA: dihydropteroate synthase, partial [Alphaproteobacteria bacterium]|nr:dihydropteroate synthase [Alphaproteobacteria bacterium]
MTEKEPNYASNLEALPAVEPEHLWLRPLGLLADAAAQAAQRNGAALPLAGGPLAFTMVEVLGRLRSGEIVAALGSIAEVSRWAAQRGAPVKARVDTLLGRISAWRAAWAGFSLDRPLVMGIVNVTPDSFSDGGDFADPQAAIAQGRAMLAAGVDILDIGGESTRPRATPVAPEDE